MSCAACGGDFHDYNQQVDDRAALVDLVGALLAGDRGLARIMAGRNFSDGDLAPIDAAITRATTLSKETTHG